MTQKISNVQGVSSIAGFSDGFPAGGPVSAPAAGDRQSASPDGGRCVSPDGAETVPPAISRERGFENTP